MITLAACPIPDPTRPRIDQRLKVRLEPGSPCARFCGSIDIEEQFHCSYELNPQFQPRFEASDLRVVGRGEAGEARVVEHARNDFYIATLFLPQMRPVAKGLHPLIAAFLTASLKA